MFHCTLLRRRKKVILLKENFSEDVTSLSFDTIRQYLPLDEK